MLINLIDRTIGWNPQLLRELKGRLKPRNLIIAVLLSGLFQLLFLIITFGMLPGSFSPMDLRINTYPNPSVEYNYSATGEASEFGYITRIDLFQPIEPNAAYPDLARTVSRVQVGDRVLSVDGTPLEDTMTYTDYQKLIEGEFAAALASPELSDRATLRSSVPGTTVKLTLNRPNVGQIDVELPRVLTSTVHNSYCRRPSVQTLPPNSSPEYGYEGTQPCQLIPGTSDYAVEWQGWFQTTFWQLSAWITFPLLALGCFWLIGDLDQEEKRGTLNFVRLSPQSAWSILSGKILGVPSLLYLAVGLILPAHFLLGLSGNLSFVRILGFDLMLGLGCLLFFSTALLFGMVCHGLGGFQAWLGGGLALMAQTFMLQTRYAHSSENTVAHWIPLFSPLSYWTELGGTGADFLNSWNWCGISGSAGAIAAFMALNFGVWSAWIWRSLRRRFYTPNATLISKQESYWLTLCFQGMLLGFVWKIPTFAGTDLAQQSQNWASNNLMGIVWLDLLFLCLLLVALTPQRQPLHDWARYRHLGLEGRKNRSLWSDLVWGKDSPALVAIALNGLILLVLAIGWLMRTGYDDPVAALATLISSTFLVLIYAAITQLILLTSWQRRAVIAFGSVAALFALPSLVLSITGTYYSELWLLVFPWPMQYVSFSLATLMAVFAVQAAGLGLLSGMLAHRLRKAGESSSKELFEEKPLALSSRETL
ncbi:MAG: hypothetical protein VKK04_03800 [Synechococcales bacterium]|nr:hypothetical protein [Synechococcales bacterium]